MSARRVVLWAGMAVLATAGAMSVRGAGAEDAAGLRQRIVDSYMNCKWEELDKLLKDNGPQIAALPKDQATDVAAVRQAELECRPAWWSLVKKGKKATFRVSLWGRGFGVTYDPDLKTTMEYSMTGGVASMKVLLPAAEMDSEGAGEHGFLRGSMADLAVFAALGSADSWTQLPPAEKALDDAGKLALMRYLDYRGNLAGVAYGDPAGRRWGFCLFLASYEKTFAELQSRMGRKALGALFICELLSHPELYKSVELPKNLEAAHAEETLAIALAKWVETHPWSFEEDAALRNAVKQFANATGPKSYTSGELTFSNKLTMALDPAADKPLEAKRDAWVKERYDAAVKQRRRLRGRV